MMCFPWLSPNQWRVGLLSPYSQPQIPTVTSSDPVHVIVYQNDGQQQQQQQQQQPISYKIPQLGVVSQEQLRLHNATSPQSTFVVNNEGSSSAAAARQQQSHYVSSPGRAVASMTAQQQTAAAKTKKDIVAQAMQEQKIFEDSLPKTEVKQEPGVAPVDAKKASLQQKPDIKPVLTQQTKTVPVIKTTTTMAKPGAKNSQQRLPTSYQQPHQLTCRPKESAHSRFDDDDDGLTCRLCLASYWYKKEMHEHLKTVHSIADPEKYDREEKEKRVRGQAWQRNREVKKENEGVDGEAEVPQPV